jgi:hypothetical protein
MAGGEVMATLLEALKAKGLVDKAKAEEVERSRTKRLQMEEKLNDLVSKVKAPEDMARAEQEEKWAKKAAKQGTKAVANSGSREYLKRFK